MLCNDITLGVFYQIYLSELGMESFLQICPFILIPYPVELTVTYRS